MYPLDEKWYGVALRAKAGEFLAAVDLDLQCKDRLLPQYVMPPLDAKENKALSIGSAIEVQIDKISQHWGKRPCLFDLRFLRFSEDHGIDASWVNQLLKRARERLCSVIPVVDLNTDFYRAAAVGAHAYVAKSGAAIRVSLNDLFDAQLRQTLENQVKNLGLKSSECIIILDLSDADLAEHVEFAKFVAEWLFKLRAFGLWARIIFQASSYPRKNPARANGDHTVRRNEWLIWQHLIELDKTIKDFVMFGDFGADHGHMDFSAIGRAIIHLRYATASEWLIARGSKDWQTIRSVAARIVNSGSFSGELFSAGDEFIASRAHGLAGVGSPMTWRYVNMNHHISLVISSLGSIYGTPIAVASTRRKAVQEEMFPKQLAETPPK